MQFGYTRVVEAEVTPAMVGQNLTLVGAQVVSIVKLLEWNSKPLVEIAPNPPKCLLFVSCQCGPDEWNSYFCPSDASVRLTLNSLDNSLNAIIFGIVP